MICELSLFLKHYVTINHQKQLYIYIACVRVLCACVLFAFTLILMYIQYMWYYYNTQFELINRGRIYVPYFRKIKS